MKNLIAGLLCAALLGGCGAHRMTPVEPQTAGDLKPEVEDADGGLVGMRPDFAPKTYTAIILLPFKVVSTEIKDDADARFAKDMVAYFQTQLLKKLQAAGLFAKVIDATASATTSGEKALRLEGDMTKLTEGSQALRYFVGFGAGAAKAQIETRLLDAQSRRIELITADRRAAGMGIFGGDGRQFVTESMDQMAEGYVKLLRHLANGGRPGTR
ncbi:MAG: DUF4410 domain-containing protein [Candidatus Rokubacteria bacterium]|nr:DUF4410 domain-containing protein [Candidatus Rokubacteria bacterium]